MKPAIKLVGGDFEPSFTDEEIAAKVDAQIEANAKAHGISVEEYEAKADGFLEGKFGDEYGLIGMVEGTYVEPWRGKEIGDFTSESSSLDKQAELEAKDYNIATGVIVAALEAVKALKDKAANFELPSFMKGIMNSVNIDKAAGGLVGASVDLDTAAVDSIHEQAEAVEADGAQPAYEMGE